MTQRKLTIIALALPIVLSSCDSGSGFHFGRDEGGSTYGLDTLPFEIRRADGSVLTGSAAVRLLRVEFYTRDAKGLTICSGAFTLDRERTSVPMSVNCNGTLALYGTVTTARSDRGQGTFTEPSGRLSTFRYGVPPTTNTGG